MPLKQPTLNLFEIAGRHQSRPVEVLAGEQVGQDTFTFECSLMNTTRLDLWWAQARLQEGGREVYLQSRLLKRIVLVARAQTALYLAAGLFPLSLKSGADPTTAYLTKANEPMRSRPALSLE